MPLVSSDRQHTKLANEKYLEIEKKIRGTAGAEAVLVSVTHRDPGEQGCVLSDTLRIQA
jgi:hypothetical protein